MLNYNINNLLIYKIKIFLIILLFIYGCTNKYKDIDINNINSSAVSLYNQTLILLNKKKFNEAKKKFNILNKIYPYTEWTRKCSIVIISNFFHQKKYEDTINIAKHYIKIYPSSSNIEYIYYIMGLSYFYQIPNINCDQKNTISSINTLKIIVDKYPKSKYFIDSISKISIAREKLAEKEMEIGRYYLMQRKYIACIKRFNKVIKEYSDTNQIQEALYRLVESYMSIGIFAEAQHAAFILSKKYNESKWYNNAYFLLKKNNIYPKQKI